MFCMPCITGRCGWGQRDHESEYSSGEGSREIFTSPFWSEAVARTQSGDGRSPNERGLSLEAGITGTRLYSFGEGLEHSPTAHEAKTYRYYCPLCMDYFKGILESNCCKHYMCYDCTLSYVAGRYGVTAEDLPFLEVPFLFPIPCPHCSSLDFAPAPVNKHSKVRCYRDEKDLSTFHKWTGSPVRIGDSFEKLQRKMLRFDNYKPEPPTPAESVEISDYNDKQLTDDLAIHTESSVNTEVPGYDEEVSIRRYREDSVSTVFDGDMGEGERSVSQPEGLEGIRYPPNLQVENRAIAAHV